MWFLALIHPYAVGVSPTANALVEMLAIATFPLEVSVDVPDIPE